MSALSFLVPGADLLDAALMYKSLRLFVFPVLPLMKRPLLGSNGWHDATSNANLIRDWWSEHPDANIGIALPLSNLAVLDIDVHRGGMATFDGWVEEHGKPPVTYTVRTPHGGLQLYYRAWPHELQELGFGKNIGPGVELIQNGYVLAPPSTVDLRKVDKDWLSNGDDPISPYTVESGEPGEWGPLPVNWLSMVTAFRDDRDHVWKHDDWSVPFGEHDTTLTQIAGGLRHYFHVDEDELRQMLKPLEHRFVDAGPDLVSDMVPRVAKSIAKRPASEILFSERQMILRRKGGQPSLDEKALQGPIGDWVRYVAKRSECHPAALLIQALAIFGNRIGASAHDASAPGFVHGATYHRTALYVMVIGESGEGAKGDAWGYAEELMIEVDPSFVAHEGVQTGEGFISALADDAPTGETAKIQGKEVEHLKKGGQRDRRYFNVESEYGRVLHAAMRPGSTLKDIVRALWDHGSTEKNIASIQQTVSDVTLSMAVHVTPAELGRDFDTVDLMSGYGNRFLFCWSKRTRLLEDERPIPAKALARFVQPLAEALDFAQEEAPEDYPFSPEAWEMWKTFVKAWKQEKYSPPMIQALKARARPQVRRLAVIYAVAEQCDCIETEHLEAALAVWDYSVQSVEAVFGDLIGDRDADRVYRVLLDHPTGVSKTDLFKVLGNNWTAKQLDRALHSLVSFGMAVERKQKTGKRGRPTSLWMAT